ncbi:MAG: F0F1-type ATP synthase membrane subunit c/vacuolar-type H+-ATPase subunit K [Rhodothermales bacterium]|jgi:F0F1-type ATP synthase membrane subunit c/vacuolar-type H+-ATPase subunit K
MRPSCLLLSLGLGFFLFLGLASVAQSVNQQIQLAQASDSAAESPSKPPAKGVSGGLILVVLIAVIVLIAMAMFGGDDFEPAPVGTTRYEVDDDDEPFLMGDFWFEGIYFRSGQEYRNAKGHIYTNRMYNANFETWGIGQGRDVERDDMVLAEVDAHMTSGGLGDTLVIDELECASLDDDTDSAS